MGESHGFVSVQPCNGTITIPAGVRRAFGLNQPGAQVEVIVRDGEIVPVPHLAVRADGTPASRREEPIDLWSELLR